MISIKYNSNVIVGKVKQLKDKKHRLNGGILYTKSHSEQSEGSHGLP